MVILGAQTTRHDPLPATATAKSASERLQANGPTVCGGRAYPPVSSDSLAFRFGAFQFVTKINLRIEIDEFARAARTDHNERRLKLDRRVMVLCDYLFYQGKLVRTEQIVWGKQIEQTTTIR